LSHRKCQESLNVGLKFYQCLTLFQGQRPLPPPLQIDCSDDDDDDDQAVLSRMCLRLCKFWLWS